jgi:nucleotide-binding universal stress UspA family protein
MYQHLLIPTDGSDLAQKAVTAGIDFARSVGARVTAFIAVPEYQLPGSAEVMAHKRVISLQEHEERSKKQAETVLAAIARRAAEAGVDYDSDYALSDRPYEAIIDAAQKHGCDLIFMASHGRAGFAEFLHGSETRGVLTHSTIPTLVMR